MSEQSNKARIFSCLEKMKSLELRIEKAGLTTVKPLAKELAKLSRQTMALLAVEIFERG